MDNGYPYKSACVPSAFHACLEQADDATCKIISEFLISKDVDVNTQVLNLLSHCYIIDVYS